MALIKDSDTRTLVPPHEPDSWFRVRPIRTSDYEHLEAAGSQIHISLDLLAQLIVGWSYPEELTRENVGMLDLDTFTWLATEIQEFSGIRTEAEKKVSSNGLSSTPPPAQPEAETEPSAASLLSLHTY